MMFSNITCEPILIVSFWQVHVSYCTQLLQDLLHIWNRFGTSTCLVITYMRF